VSLPGSPRLPRSSLDRGTRSATTTPDMEMLRRRVWQQQGVVSVPLRTRRSRHALGVEKKKPILIWAGGHLWLRLRSRRRPGTRRCCGMRWPRCRRCRRSIWRRSASPRRNWQPPAATSRGASCLHSHNCDIIAPTGFHRSAHHLGRVRAIGEERCDIDLWQLLEQPITAQKEVVPRQQPAMGLVQF